MRAYPFFSTAASMVMVAFVCSCGKAAASSADGGEATAGAVGANDLVPTVVQADADTTVPPAEATATATSVATSPSPSDPAPVPELDLTKTPFTSEEYCWARTNWGAIFADLEQAGLQLPPLPDDCAAAVGGAGNSASKAAAVVTDDMARGRGIALPPKVVDGNGVPCLLIYFDNLFWMLRALPFCGGKLQAPNTVPGSSVMTCSRMNGLASRYVAWAGYFRNVDDCVPAFP